MKVILLIAICVFGFLLDGCTENKPKKEEEPQREASYTLYCGTEPDGVTIVGEMKILPGGSAFRLQSGSMIIYASLGRCIVFEKAL